MNEKLSMLGKPVVIAGKGGRVQVAILIHYDEPSDSYDGAAFHPGLLRVRAGEGSSVSQSGSLLDTVPLLPAHGLRRYPYNALPDYAFQFVLPGEDAQPLIDIAQRNADATRPQAVADQPGESSGINTADALDTQPLDAPKEEFDPADRNRDGVVTSKERKQHERDR